MYSQRNYYFRTVNVQPNRFINVLWLYGGLTTYETGSQSRVSINSGHATKIADTVAIGCYEDSFKLSLVPIILFVDDLNLFPQ